MVLSQGQMIVNDKVINTLLHTLSVRERDALVFRFWDGYTLKKIGEEFGVTRSRADQIFKKAIRKLRNPARIKYLQFHGYIKPVGRFPWECDMTEEKIIERLKVLEELSVNNYPKKKSRITKTKSIKDQPKAVDRMFVHLTGDVCHLPEPRPWMNFK